MTTKEQKELEKLIEQQTEQMRQNVIGLELKARANKAQHDMMYYFIEADKIEEQYHERYGARMKRMAEQYDAEQKAKEAPVKPLIVTT